MTVWHNITQYDTEWQYDTVWHSMMVRFLWALNRLRCSRSFVLIISFDYSVPVHQNNATQRRPHHNNVTQRRPHHNNATQRRPSARASIPLRKRCVPLRKPSLVSWLFSSLHLMFTLFKPSMVSWLFSSLRVMFTCGKHLDHASAAVQLRYARSPISSIIPTSCSPDANRRWCRDASVLSTSCSPGAEMLAVRCSNFLLAA